MKYRIHGGILLLPAGKQKKDLLISNGKIEAIIAPQDVTSDIYLPVSAEGCYVSPGFVDMHQHGGGGSDYMDGTPEAFYQATEAHLQHGITSVMATLLSARYEDIIRAIDAYKIAQKDPRMRANLLGLHLEGPYISPAKSGAQKPEHIRNFDYDEYRKIAKIADGHIKRWSVAPEVEGADLFADFATSNGIVLSIAHSNADFDTVLRAYKKGFRHITHLYSCLSTIVRCGGFRKAGVMEAAYYLEDMNVEIIADGCHLPPSLLSYVYKFKQTNRISLITDGMRAAGQMTNRSFLGSVDDPLPVLIEDGVAKLEDRSAFAGSIATGDRLVRTMIECGVPLEDAIKMVTINPIQMMNLQVQKGQLCEGYDADICIFDEAVQMHGVFCNGVPVTLC